MSNTEMSMPTSKKKDVKEEAPLAFEKARAAFLKVCDELEESGYQVHGKHRIPMLALSQVKMKKGE